MEDTGVVGEYLEEEPGLEGDCLEVVGVLAECLEDVRGVTGQFWDLYTAEEPASSDVHLLPYPYTISETGDVSALEGEWSNFPDTAAPVLGAKSGVLPGKLTT